MPGARDGQLRINRGADSPAWSLLIWDDAAQIYRLIGKAGIEMQWRGSFVPDGSYYVGDVVRVASSAYICTASPSHVLDTRVDTFVRADQVDWGTASDGHVWRRVRTVTPGLESISSNQGLATTDGSGNGNLLLLGPALAGPEIDVSMRWNVTVSVGGDDGVLIFLGVDDLIAGNSCTVLLNGTIAITVPGSPGYTNSSAWSGGSAGTAYRTRCQIEEDTVRVRVWADGTAEPGAWNVEWPSGVTVLPGAVGLANIDDNPSTTVTFDLFDAHMLRTSVPYPTVDSAHWELVAG